ncbi:hypothetical protein [Rhodococcus sp. 14-2470-1a]|uniref:hypothetical protein n=1 Tax=Rhodococcus sp. 14-2470-1a TaxID=2023150 RepID=UPI00117992D6|nr:hypothetical protein [Rhodococcus sp. 14-2470-1a]
MEEFIKQYKVDDNSNEEPEGDLETDDDENPEKIGTPWPRATSLYIAPIGLAGDPSEEALHKQEELAEQYDCLEEEEQYWFDIKMFWWDQDPDPTYVSEGTYPEGSHVIVINGTKSGQMRATSKLTEPGRIVHSFNRRPRATHADVLLLHPHEAFRLRAHACRPQGRACIGERLRRLQTGVLSPAPDRRNAQLVDRYRVQRGPLSDSRTEARCDLPASLHPDALLGMRRKRAILRPDDSWEKYGFTDDDRIAWLRGGLTKDEAHFAAMCRGAMSVPGIRFTPEKLNWLIGDSTILDRLRRGKNIIRIQLAFAAHRGIEHTVDTRLIRALELKTGKATELPELAHLGPLALTARKMPRVIDGLAIRAGHVVDILGPVIDLRLEADVFRATGLVPPLLTQAAKAHGIYSRGSALDDFIAGLALGIGEVRGCVEAAHIIRKVARTRRFYSMPSETASLLEAASENDMYGAPVAVADLPSQDGVALVWNDEDKPEFLLSWASHGENIDIALTSARYLAQKILGSKKPNAIKSATATLHLSADRSDLPPVVTNTNDPESSVVPVFLAFVHLLREQQMIDRNAVVAEPSTTSPEPIHGAQYRDEVQVLTISPRAGLSETNVGQRVLDHQWLVRGHWRRQWFPSLGVHKLIWIAEHPSGPSDRPLVARDRVLVVKPRTRSQRK